MPALVVGLVEYFTVCASDIERYWKAPGRLLASLSRGLGEHFGLIFSTRVPEYYNVEILLLLYTFYSFEAVSCSYVGLAPYFLHHDLEYTSDSKVCRSIYSISKHLFPNDAAPVYFTCTRIGSGHALNSTYTEWRVVTPSRQYLKSVVRLHILIYRLWIATGRMSQKVVIRLLSGQHYQPKPCRRFQFIESKFKSLRLTFAVACLGAL